MTCGSFFTIGAAALCVLLYGRLVKAGYYAALLPLLASAAYIVLEAEWVYSGQGAVAGTLRNVGWAAVEIGRTGGSALVIVALLRDFRRIGEGVRCDLRNR